MGEQRKDLFTKLAEAGEDAIQRLSDMPGLTKVTESVNTMRTRVDDLSRRMRGVEDLERRIEVLEKRVDKLSGPKARRRTTTGRASRPGTTRRTSPPPELPPPS